MVNYFANRIKPKLQALYDNDSIFTAGLLYSCGRW